MKKKFLVTLLCLVLTISLSSCTTLKTQVAYTIYPIGYLIDRIAQDTVTSESIQENVIVQRATIKDDYESILNDSDGLFEIGQVEPYLTLYQNNIESISSSVNYLSGGNTIYKFERYTPVVLNGEVTYLESSYYDGDIFTTIDTNDSDMYIWVDPIIMLSMAKNVRDWLIEQYPDNKKLYEENCNTLETELVGLDAAYQALATKNLNEGKTIKFVSMTASFGNWQKAYNIQVYPVILSKYGVLPTDEQLEAIKERIREDGVKYIVYEPNMTSDMIELFNSLEEELGLTRAELSNLSSLTDSQLESGKDYVSIMYENLSTLESMAEVSDTSVHDVIDN